MSFTNVLTWNTTRLHIAKRTEMFKFEKSKANGKLDLKKIGLHGKKQRSMSFNIQKVARSGIQVLGP